MNARTWSGCCFTSSYRRTHRSAQLETGSRCSRSTTSPLGKTLPGSKETAMTQDTNPAQMLKSIAVAKDEGEARWWFGSLAVIKATAADTGGQMTIIEITEPPEMEGPLHVHHGEDEGFWILEGDATF